MATIRKILRKRRTANSSNRAQTPLITASAPKITIPQPQVATPAARAAQTDFAGQAEGVNTARINFNKAGEIVGGEFGFGPNVQKYDPRKIAWVMGRGASGGSLSTADKAVYDRMMYLRAQKAAQEQQAAQEQKALDAAHAEDERKRRLDAEEWNRQEKFRRDARNEDEIAREKRKAEADAAALAEKRKYDEQQAQLQAQAKLDAENAKYEALNKKHGIAEGTRLSDKDYNDLEAGRSKWGYSRTDQQAIDTINNDMDEARRNGKFTPEELAKAEEEAKAKIGGFQKRLMPNDQPPTAEQIYNGAIDAPDGTKLVASGNGGLVAIPGTGPQKPIETPEQKLDTKMKDYLLGEVGNARKAWETAVSQGKIDIESEEIPNPSNANGAPVMIPNPNYGKTFDEAAALKAARNNWNAVYGAPPSAPSVPAPNPQGGGATPTVSPTTDPRKKWAQFAD